MREWLLFVRALSTFSALCRRAGLMSCAAGLALASLAACGKAPPADRGATAQPTPKLEHVELRVDASGLKLDALEAEVVVPIEAKLLEVEGVEQLTTELRPGRARFELQLEAGRYAAAMDEIRSQMATLQAQLPAGVVAPRPYELGDGEATVTYVIESEARDLNELGAAVRALEQEVRASAGVVRSDRCSPRARLSIELEPARLSAYGLDPRAIEVRLREAIGADAGAPQGLAALRTLSIGEGTLAELAAFRVSFRAPPCVAAGAQGIAASLRVEVAGPRLAAGLEETLARFVASLPEGTHQRRVEPDSAVLRLSLAAGLDAEVGAELLGGGFGRDAAPWLVEVGVEGEPCWGAGLHARVSLPAGTELGAIAQALRDNPGIASVAGDGREPTRVWIAGPTHGAVDEAAGRVVAALGELEHVAGVELHRARPQPEPEVEVDAARLAELGLTRADFDAQLALIEGAVVGELSDGRRGQLEVVLRASTQPEADPAAQLRSATIRVGERELPLLELARVRELERDTRRCRRGGRPAVLLGVWPRGQRREALESVLSAALDASVGTQRGINWVFDGR